MRQETGKRCRTVRLAKDEGFFHAGNTRDGGAGKNELGQRHVRNVDIRILAANDVGRESLSAPFRIGDHLFVPPPMRATMPETGSQYAAKCQGSPLTRRSQIDLPIMFVYYSA